MPDTSLVMFDLDGTLVNTVESIVECANMARLEFHYPKRKHSEIFNMVGMPPLNFFNDLKISEIEGERLVREFRLKLNAVNFGITDLYPSTIKVLTALSDNGLKLAVTTNKPTANAELLLKKTGVRHFFSHVQGSDGLNPKPHPDILRKTIEICNSQRSLMVGDRSEDMIAAKQLGVISVGVAQTAHSKLTLLEAGAAYAFDTIEEFGNEANLNIILDTIR